MYVFPGIGLGAILCKAVNVTQDMIYASGEYLSRALSPEETAQGFIYPDVSRIREVSLVVTRGVIRTAQKNGVDRELSIRNLDDDQLDEYIKHRMYDPFKEGDGVKHEMAEMLSKRTNGLHEEAPRAAAGAHL
jgi:malate dehydrogenase (oxaloacetate-decarboxylating)(NADP+)